jgi:hypothetical protein
MRGNDSDFDDAISLGGGKPGGFDIQDGQLFNARQGIRFGFAWHNWIIIPPIIGQ